MDENAVFTLVAMETASPKWRMTRSAGAVYTALIVLIIGCISVGNLLYERFSLPRHVTQPALYAMIAIAAYYIYRRHFLRYRYTLTSDTLAMEQLGGKVERILAVISLNDIHQIQRSDDKYKNKAKIVRASLPPYREATKVFAMIDEKEIQYEISASEEFSAKLVAQWQSAKMVKVDEQAPSQHD
ncbi:MAG: hypothetical protein VB061_05250 [Christensenella sp.]|nr:hypothetical protein [Christensenella sp.]